MQITEATIDKFLADEQALGEQLVHIAAAHAMIISDLDNVDPYLADIIFNANIIYGVWSDEDGNVHAMKIKDDGGSERLECLWYLDYATVMREKAALDDLPSIPAWMVRDTFGDISGWPAVTIDGRQVGYA